MRSTLFSPVFAILFIMGRGELVSRIESNMPFFACVCPYAYAYALVKIRLNGVHSTYWLKISSFQIFGQLGGLASKFHKRLARYRLNRTPKRTNFQPVGNSFGTV